MSEPIVNTNATVETLQTLQTPNKTPIYMLRAQKNYYNRIKNNLEFKIANNENATNWIKNNKEKHNKNQKLYRERKKAKLLAEKAKESEKL